MPGRIERREARPRQGGVDGGRIPSQQGEGQGWLQGLCNLKQSQTIAGNQVGRALRASVTVTRLAATTGPLIRGCGPPGEASLPWNMESGENYAPKWSSSLGRNVGQEGPRQQCLHLLSIRAPF